MGLGSWKGVCRGSGCRFWEGNDVGGIAVVCESRRDQRREEEEEKEEEKEEEEEEEWRLGIERSYHPSLHSLSVKYFTPPRRLISALGWRCSVLGGEFMVGGWGELTVTTIGLGCRYWHVPPERHPSCVRCIIHCEARWLYTCLMPLTSAVSLFKCSSMRRQGANPDQPSPWLAEMYWW